MQRQVALAGKGQQPQHADRLAIEIGFRRRQDLAVGQHEAGGAHRGIGLAGLCGLAQRLSQHSGLEHVREAHDLARGQEIVAHEALDANLAPMPCVAHAGPDHRLHVEGEAFLGAAGDVVQVEAHRPQEVPGATGALGLLLGQQAAAAMGLDADQLPRLAAAEHVATQPVQRLHVAQAAAAFLDIGLDQEGAFAIALVSQAALALLVRR